VVAGLREVGDRVADHGMAVAVQNHHDVAVHTAALLELLHDAGQQPALAGPGRTTGNATIGSDGPRPRWSELGSSLNADREVQRRADPKVQRSEPPTRSAQGCPGP
jgi:hypothetical protein